MNNKIIIFFIIFLANVFHGQTSQSDFSFAEPDSIHCLKKTSLWATQYYIHKFRSSGKIAILDENGKSLGLYADTCNFCEAALEGTAFVTDSAGTVFVINYAARNNTTQVNCRKCAKYAKSKLAVESWGKTRWKKSSAFGEGVNNYKLIPFRTIAVDSTVIPYGTVIFIPLAKNKALELPDGSIVKHDGYFFAGDTGGAIKKDHIDIFTGIYAGNPFADIITSNPAKHFTAYFMSDELIKNSLNALQIK